MQACPVITPVETRNPDQVRPSCRAVPGCPHHPAQFRVPLRCASPRGASARVCSRDGPGMLDQEKAHDQSRYRSEEHTSELQSLMRSSYDVFCLKKKKKNKYNEAHKET